MAAIPAIRFIDEALIFRLSICYIADAREHTMFFIRVYFYASYLHCTESGFAVIAAALEVSGRDRASEPIRQRERGAAV
jgi:hypothetical protein